MTSRRRKTWSRSDKTPHNQDPAGCNECRHDQRLFVLIPSVCKRIVSRNTVYTLVAESRNKNNNDDRPTPVVIVPCGAPPPQRVLQKEPQITTSFVLRTRNHLFILLYFGCSSDLLIDTHVISCPRLPRIPCPPLIRKQQPIPTTTSSNSRAVRTGAACLKKTSNQHTGMHC